MARRFHTRSTPAQNIRIILRAIPWRLLLLIPVLILFAIPAFYFGTHAGKNVLPALTNFFYKASGPPAPPAPTPYPSFPALLPQVGSILYTVQVGDACDEVLAYHMHMTDAGTIFSDVQPETIKALDASIGQDCHNLQPGMVLTLSPHYPLVAFGGLVLKVVATAPQQVLPTPVITVVTQQQVGIDCSNGCLLTVRLAPGTQIYLNVQTTLPVKVGSWVWAQAMLARKKVANFGTYPYADPATSLNGMTMSACDLQVDNTHDDNSLSCSQLTPNTINDDNGSWLFGVTGSNSLAHWAYPLHLPAGTQVLLWLSLDRNGNLYFQKGNPVYKYDAGSHLYVRV
jgi:hypothetical protein